MGMAACVLMRGLLCSRSIAVALLHKAVEAGEDGHTDLALDSLTVGVASGQTLAQLFQPEHLRFGGGPAVIPAPLSPDGSTEAFPRHRAGGFKPQGLGILAARHDGGGTSGSPFRGLHANHCRAVDGVMALAGAKALSAMTPVIS